MEHEPVAVGREHERNVERCSVFEPLLHPFANAVSVVLGLDDRDRDVGLVVEDEVRLLALAARDELPTHDDPSGGEVNFLANLQQLVPACLFYGGQDELRADVAFCE